MEDTNIVELSGIVSSEIRFSHSNYGINFYTCKLDIMRSSGFYDSIPLIIPSNMMYDIQDKYVSVCGQIRTRNVDGHLMVSLYVQEIDMLDIDAKDIIDINIVELHGHICSKKELRSTPLNRTICDFILCVNRGNNRTDYIPVISWGNTAKCVDKMSVGDEITVYGRFQSREYKEGKIAYEVSAKNIVLED